MPGKGLEPASQAASHQSDTVMPPRDNKVNASDLTPSSSAWSKSGSIKAPKAKCTPPSDVWKPIPEVLQPVLAVAVTGDGQYAACGRANQISIYHLPSKQLVARLTDPQLIEGGLYQQPGVAHRDLVNSLAFNPDGTLLASGDYRQVKLWRRPRDVQKLTLGGTLGRSLQTLAVSPDGHWLAVARDDNEIKLFRLPEAKDAKVLMGHEKRITVLAFSPDGTKLASGAEDKSVRVWDVRDGELFARGSSPGEVRALAWVIDGTRIATSGPDSTIQLWKLPETAHGELAAVKDSKAIRAVTSLQATGTNRTELSPAAPTD